MALTYTVTINATPITLTLNKGTDGLTPYIGENGNWWIGLTDTGVKAEANSIESVELLSKVGLVATYRITFTDTTHFDYTVSDGAQGAQGAKGDTGKSAYQSYLDTTTDNPPLSESAWANLFGSKLDIDGDGSTVTSDSSDSADPNMDFPSQGNLWNLSAWFSLIKAKVNRLFVLAPNVFNVTATGDGTTWSFDAFDMAEFEDCTTNTLEGKTIKVHFKGYDGGGAVILDIFYDGAFRFDEYTGTLYIDCFELSRSFYIGGEMRDTPINIELVGYLFKNGNGSNTTVNFTEAGVTALPASGEKQSTLWGKVLRYLKTQTPKILNITATRALPTDDWTFGTFSTTEFTAIAAIASNGAPIYVRFSGTTGGVAEPVMMYPGLWNETLQQVTSRDLARGFYLNGGVATNRGARSYDTQKYIDIGAVFNDVTGYYEYLGLTNITESWCRESYNLWLGPKTPFYFNYRYLVSKKTQFLFPITWVDESLTSARPTLFYGSERIKRIRLCADMMLPDSPTNLFYAGSGIAYLTNSSEITYIGGGIDMKSVVTDGGAGNLISAGCTHIMLYNCKVGINLSASQVLDYESVLNVPKYSAAAATKIFTLASAVATSARAAYLLNPEPGYATLDLYCQSKNYSIGTV